MARLTAFFIVVLVLLATPIWAQEGTFWNGPFPDRGIRAAQAEDLLRSFAALDKQVPTLSPSEAAWLKREYDDQVATGGNFTARALSASNPKEFNVRVVRQNLDEILGAFRSIASNRISLQTEVRQWITLADNFIDLIH